jgi:hypothetical protein
VSAASSRLWGRVFFCHNGCRDVHLHVALLSSDRPQVIRSQSTLCRSPLEARDALERRARSAAPFSLADGTAYIKGEVITIDGGQWLQGAGRFSVLQVMLNAEAWQALRPKAAG